ncbi:MAG TPA: transposase [Acidocella sp.]|nr:transposase [Acidocella sp.]
MSDILSPTEIEKLAAKNGRTMPEVCRLAGVAPSTFSRWRAKKTSPSIDVYQRIRDAAAMTEQLQEPADSQA